MLTYALNATIKKVKMKLKEKLNIEKIIFTILNAQFSRKIS